MDMRDAQRNEMVTKVENVGTASDGPMIGTALLISINKLCDQMNTS